MSRSLPACKRKQKEDGEFEDNIYQKGNSEGTCQHLLREFIQLLMTLRFYVNDGPKQHIVLLLCIK